MAEKVNRREQVKELIATGNYTKAEIAAELGVNDASVSSQMTYLRWMGNFILANADKKLRFVTQEEAEAAEAAVIANRKVGTTSAKSPQERADALVKTIKTQESAYAKALAKCKQVDKDLEDDSNDEELLEIKEEADANEVILRLKLKRNKALAAELPEPNVADVVADIPETSDDEDLL